MGKRDQELTDEEKAICEAALERIYHLCDRCAGCDSWPGQEKVPQVHFPPNGGTPLGYILCWPCDDLRREGSQDVERANETWRELHADMCQR